MNPIAIRQYKIFRDNVESGRFFVKILAPKQTPVGNFRCEFIFEGIVDNTLRHGDGEDSLQALVIALKLIMENLSNYERKNGVKITWLNNDEFGLF